MTIDQIEVGQIFKIKGQPDHYKKTPIKDGNAIRIKDNAPCNFDEDTGTFNVATKTFYPVDLELI